MEQHRFFRGVWRLNSLIIAIAGMMAIGALAWLGVQLVREFHRPHQGYNVANATEEAEREVAWRLGGMSTVDGHPYLIVPLWADEDAGRGYAGKVATSARNLLFINGDTNDSHWLFPDHQRLIQDHTMLKRNCVPGETALVRAVLLDIVRDDTNGDARWTSADQHVIALVGPDGRGYREVAAGVDRLVGHHVVSDDVILLVFERANTIVSTRVSLTGFDLLDEATIPELR